MRSRAERAAASSSKCPTVTCGVKVPLKVPLKVPPWLAAPPGLQRCASQRGIAACSAAWSSSSASERDGSGCSHSVADLL